MQSTFVVKKKDLGAALKQMETVGSRFNQATMLKVSVLPNAIEIDKQGMTRIVKATTDGLADIMVPGLLLKGYVSTSSNAEMTFTFTNREVRCGSSIFSSPLITVETVFNMPENELPINATRISLLRYAAGKTEEELKRLGLSTSVIAAKRLCSEKVQKAAALLTDYDVSYEELKKWVDNRIYGKLFENNEND